MTNDIFRTVRELLQSNKCVLMGNAVNNEGELYDDSVENLTAILAMQDSYAEMLAVICEMLGAAETDLLDETSNVWRSAMISARATIAKAKGN
jgi:hypothetical protein